MRQTVDGDDVVERPPQPRAFRIMRRRSPSGENGWCSCCHGPAPWGVMLSAPTDRPEVFFFICFDCAKQIGGAAA